MSRKDDTIVHEAIREALVNSLIHADHRGQGGVVVEKYRDRLVLSNPGSLLIDVEQVWEGGVSECRNKTLQTMFNLLGYGEKAGSGFDKIRKGWESQQWRTPFIEETARPDRVRVVLPMVSLLPDQSLERMRHRFGSKFDPLTPLEVQALVTADVETSVSNSRMQQVSTEHPADLTRLLQGLLRKGFLAQAGQKRGTRYRLAEDSSHLAGNSSHLAGNSSHLLGSLPEQEVAELKALAAAAVACRKLPSEQIRAIILRLCDGRYLPAPMLAGLLNRNLNALRSRFLKPMVEEGLLVRKYPAEPNRPDQAYTAIR